MSTTTNTTVQVHRVYIKATPERIWEAITKPEWAEKYGYRSRVEYDLRPGGAYRGYATTEMKDTGMPDVIIDGEVIEADPPRKLVQTWNPAWIDEPVTRLTFEIAEGPGGVCSLTVVHDVTDAPQTGDQVAGRLENAGGGWPQTLSDLKSLLETGQSMYA